jgi:histidinol-phosphate aminotransferase
MSAYSAPLEFDGAKLNQNESPLDIPLPVKEKIFQRLRQSQWNRYPSLKPAPLIEHIAAYTGFPGDGILLGNGSNELIQTVILGCCDAGDSLLTVTPTFSVYRRMASVMNLELVEVPLKEDFSFDVPVLTENAKKAGIIILASPNNPTGSVLEPSDIETIARNTGALVVMDEAYYEFSRQSAQTLINSHPNIVILRTFSKAFGAAGLRLGYLLGATGMVNELEKTRLPFSVGMFQQVAGEVILEQRTQLQNVTGAVIDERQRVYHSLQEMPGIAPVPSQANFLLFKSLALEAGELFKRLYRGGVLVRAYDSPELDGMLRVSIGTATDNNLFLERLRFILDTGVRAADQEGVRAAYKEREQ